MIRVTNYAQFWMKMTNCMKNWSFYQRSKRRRMGTRNLRKRGEKSSTLMKRSASNWPRDWTSCQRKMRSWCSSKRLKWAKLTSFDLILYTNPKKVSIQKRRVVLYILSRSVPDIVFQVNQELTIFRKNYQILLDNDNVLKTNFNSLQEEYEKLSGLWKNLQHEHEQKEMEMQRLQRENKSLHTNLSDHQK